MPFFQRWLFVLLVLAAGAAVLPGCAVRQGGPGGKPDFELVVLHTNDTHGHPVAFDRYPEKRVGGLPARATIVERIRRDHPNVLLLDAGDLNTGRLVSNMFQAEPDVRGYNALGYDAVALGNHEFDPPRSVLRRQMDMAAFPFLSANVRTRGGSLLAQSHRVFSFDGFRVAVLGLTTPETREIARPENVRDLVFEDPVETARALVPVLRREADLVIALTHLGIYPGTDKGARRLAREVPGIDLIVDGHTHTRMDAPIVADRPGEDGGTLIVQAWQWGLVLGKLKLTVRDGRVRGHAFEAIPVNPGVGAERVPEDPEMLALLEPYVERAAAAGARVIGRARGLFPNDRVRQEETALGDLVADSMIWSAANLAPDLAVQNGGAIRSSIPPGDLTVGRIHDVLPFDNTVVVVELRGRDVRALFDRAASLEDGHGGFLQVSRGVEIVLGAGKGPCLEVRVNGRPLQDGRVYRVAANAFLASGGDGYDVFQKALRRIDTSRFLRNVLVDYIAHLGGEIAPATGRRIQRRLDSRARPLPGGAGERAARPKSNRERSAGETG